MLEVAAERARDPLMARFFGRLIDSRNLMTLYKQLRLELPSTPAFIAGGTIPPAKLAETAKEGDLPAVGMLVREFTGITLERPEPTAIETALYRGMTRWLRKEGKDPFGIAQILDYLWQCSLEAMNASVLGQTRGLERELVLPELVQ
jgi:vacuolar-type H+-ATPase subunit C/Vma6